jgi:GntR family histidine utilization transcriptional repressor
MAENPYQIIRRSIAEDIASGRYKPGQMLPSEHALCDIFHVSRMTVSRAMRELSAENLVRRVPGVGSFVAEKPAESALVEIHNIADEIALRGHVHSADVHVLETVPADAADRADFGLSEDAVLFHSLILHFENGVPLQLEDRKVNPALAPDYLAQDFTCTTPNAYLSQVAPLQLAEHGVQAARACSQTAFLLALDPEEPCLVVTRRTWSGSRQVTAAKLFYPGNRFRLTGRFAPQGKN